LWSRWNVFEDDKNVRKGVRLAGVFESRGIRLASRRNISGRQLLVDFILDSLQCDCMAFRKHYV
jgi:hypothetical protein